MLVGLGYRVKVLVLALWRVAAMLQGLVVDPRALMGGKAEDKGLGSRGDDVAATRRVRHGGRNECNKIERDDDVGRDDGTCIAERDSQYFCRLRSCPTKWSRCSEL